MDLVSVNKYESIAERIKRLNSGASTCQPKTRPINIPNVSRARAYVSPQFGSQQIGESFEGIKNTFPDKKTVSRVITQETEQNAN